MVNCEIFRNFKRDCKGSDLSNILCLSKYSDNCKYLLEALHVLFNVTVPNEGLTFVLGFSNVRLSTNCKFQICICHNNPDTRQ